MVAAIELVRAAHPHVVFLLVGASIDEAGAVGKRLECAVPVEAYRLIPRQPLSRMSRYLATADVAVSPRQYGSNLPLKVVEYLAAGLAIVATDIPAHTSLLDDQTAVLVESTAAGIAQGIIRLLDDSASRGRYGAAAQAYASKHLGRAAFLRSVAHLFDNLDGVELPR